MCYSAEAWTLYKQYVDEFGADIDIKAFWELYLGRDEAYRIRHKLSGGTKIPKGMDLNYLRPASELERKIQDLIGEWNGRKLAESEAELAAQEARLASAEAKLAVKETKTALNEQRIAGPLSRRGRSHPDIRRVLGRLECYCRRPGPTGVGPRRRRRIARSLYPFVERGRRRGVGRAY